MNAPLPRVITNYSEHRRDIVYLADGSRWRVARYNVDALEGWRIFDPVEIGGLDCAPLITNIRRMQVFQARKLAPGEE
jgi:hypothetical protein